MMRFILVALLALVMFIPVAQAEEQVEYTSCFSGTWTTFHDSKDLAVIGGWQVNGINITHSENKLFNGGSFHCEGLTRIMGEKIQEFGYCRSTDPDGDIVINDWTRTEKEMGGKFLEGTGKYKGIKGTIKAERLLVGKPAMPGTIQMCNKMTATYELAK